MAQDILQPIPKILLDESLRQLKQHILPNSNEFGKLLHVVGMSSSQISTLVITLVFGNVESYSQASIDSLKPTITIGMRHFQTQRRAKRKLPSILAHEAGHIMSLGETKGGEAFKRFIKKISESFRSGYLFDPEESAPRRIARELRRSRQEFDLITFVTPS